MRVEPSRGLEYEHFFYFKDAAGARGAIEELVRNGFDVDALPPGKGVEDWTIIATRRESLNVAPPDALTIALDGLARRHGGSYDGWGTPL